MAATTWTESRTALEPAGCWGKMPSNYGAGNAGVSNTWNIPAHDPATQTIPTEYWQEQGRGANRVGRFTAAGLVIAPPFA